jgi:uncharacterized membrane protein YgdD (TMEM256/DUF423 family)
MQLSTLWEMILRQCSITDDSYQLSTLCSYQLYAAINFMQLSTLCSYQLYGKLFCGNAPYLIIAIIYQLYAAINFMQLSTLCSYQL